MHSLLLRSSHRTSALVQETFLLVLRCVTELRTSFAGAGNWSTLSVGTSMIRDSSCVSNRWTPCRHHIGNWVSRILDPLSRILGPYRQSSHCLNCQKHGHSTIPFGVLEQAFKTTDNLSVEGRHKLFSAADGPRKFRESALLVRHISWIGCHMGCGHCAGCGQT